MSRHPSAVTQASLLPLLGSQGLHHLRYLIAPDHAAGVTLQAHGHGASHLVATGPAIGILMALVLAGLVVSAAGAPRRTTAVRTVRVRRLWPLAVAALLAIYGSQELLEGVLGRGHEGGLGALWADGGWVALPIAIALGGVIAFVVRVAGAADALVCNPAIGIVLRLVAAVATLVRPRAADPPRTPFSLDGAGRGPPVVV